MRAMRRLRQERDAALMKAEALSEVLAAQREWIDSRKQRDIVDGMTAVASQQRFRRPD